MVSKERDLIDSNKAGRLYSADVRQGASADQVSPPFHSVRALMRWGKQSSTHVVPFVN